jgi:outer membrane protein
MKKIKAIHFIFILFCGNSLLLKGQESQKLTQPMSLEACIDYALKNNIQIKQSELNTELSQVNLTQSQGNLLPAFNANASHTYNFGRTIDRFTNQFATQQVLSQNLSVSSDVTIFNGLQTYNTIQQNKYNYLASKYDVEKMKNDISLNIASAYLQVLFATELVENARNQVGISNSRCRCIRKRNIVGYAGAAIFRRVEPDQCAKSI